MRHPGEEERIPHLLPPACRRNMVAGRGWEVVAEMTQGQAPVRCLVLAQTTAAGGLAEVGR
jgi:hypothetical protein